ncbi:uncharacterized protein TRAVEDRAFT_26744, partial [Trametes versicolor FP-101664 SS1]|uniref:uncharacterized protein n=1 Tax=Trametes versicolor (strain FP-101664) TaxID=717944 RepID=UPI00046215E6
TGQRPRMCATASFGLLARRAFAHMRERTTATALYHARVRALAKLHFDDLQFVRGEPWGRV